MTPRLRAWLDGRSPPPPEDLRGRILDAVGDGDGASDAEVVAEALLDAALSRLAVARSRPGRVRETAFELLVADALLTYACEAALESDAPEETLTSILGPGASS